MMDQLISTTACILFLLVLFRTMAIAADDFFSVVLSQISQEMGLPPRLAGVTLLSLGNGAPDLSSSIAAVKAGDYPLALGSLTGGSMFVVCVVAGRIILLCRGVSARGAQLRDVGFFAAAWVLIAGVVAGRSVGAGAVGGLLALYTLYVIVVAAAALLKRLRSPDSPSSLALLGRALTRTFSSGRAPEPEPGAGAQRAASGALPPPLAATLSTPGEQLEQGLLNERKSAFAAHVGRAMSASHASSGRSDASALEMTPVTTEARHRAHRAPPVASFEPRGSYRQLLEMSVEEYRSAALAAMAESRSYRRGEGELRRHRRGRRGAWVPPGRAATLPLPDFVPQVVRDTLSPAYSSSYPAEEDGFDDLEAGDRLDDEGGSTDGESSASTSSLSSRASTQSLPQLYDFAPTRRGRGAEASGAARDGNDGVGLDRPSLSAPVPLHRAARHELARDADVGPPIKEEPTQAVGSRLSSPTKRLPRPESAFELAVADQLARASAPAATGAPARARPAPAAPAPAPGLKPPPPALLRLRAAWAAARPALGAALACVDTPIVLALRATIPLVERGSYSRLWFALACALCPLTCCFARAPPPAWTLGASWPLGALCLALGGFGVAALWINGVASELVGLLQFFGVLSGVDATVLGVTVLAWGNSLADLMTNVSLARRGTHGTSMAMTACFAGPLFNALIGLGVGFAVALHGSGGGALPVSLPLIAALGVAFALAAAAAVVLAAALNRYHLPAWVGTMLLLWYLAYMVSVIIAVVAGGAKAS
ncbi:hypothetical protein QBZ16_000721 [Prototheca wickerhamii]|uniref:Sodium/calcium exchanger membrane region domain-containing protein n=1 Tax=Prototheca wickerhamii TaxID=3111 RepID=A0AAD9MK37_PROWI|nr:hypothetical protein QBZ16_000721 [Prototheca wickerhamii]